MTPEENKWFTKCWNLSYENDRLKIQVSQLKQEIKQLYKYFNLGRIYTWQEYVNNVELSYEEHYKRTHNEEYRKQVFQDYENKMKEKYK